MKPNPLQFTVDTLDRLQLSDVNAIASNIDDAAVLNSVAKTFAKYLIAHKKRTVSDRDDVARVALMLKSASVWDRLAPNEFIERYGHDFGKDIERVYLEALGMRRQSSSSRSYFRVWLTPKAKAKSAAKSGSPKVKALAKRVTKPKKIEGQLVIAKKSEKLVKKLVAMKKVDGTVKGFDQAKGFVRFQLDEGREMLVRIGSAKKPSSSLRQGQRLTFEKMPTKGKSAVARSSKRK